MTRLRNRVQTGSGLLRLLQLPDLGHVARRAGLLDADDPGDWVDLSFDALKGVRDYDVYFGSGKPVEPLVPQSVGGLLLDAFASSGTIALSTSITLLGHAVGISILVITASVVFLIDTNRSFACSVS